MFSVTWFFIARLTALRSVLKMEACLDKVLGTLVRTQKMTFRTRPKTHSL